MTKSLIIMMKCQCFRKMRLFLHKMIDLNGVKNIIFDFGNVICDIDFDRTVRAFQALGGNNFELTVEEYIHDPIFGALEKGDIELPEFRDKIRHLLNADVADAAIDKAWAAVIINSDQARIDMLKRIKEHYRICLLSNTNQIHIDTSFQRINTSFGVDFASLFEKVYFSYELKLAKPDPAIYEYVFKNMGIKAEETLLIDDNGPNIEAAAHLGMKTYLFNPKEDSLEELL